MGRSYGLGHTLALRRVWALIVADFSMSMHAGSNRQRLLNRGISKSRVSNRGGRVLAGEGDMERVWLQCGSPDIEEVVGQSELH